MERDLHGLLSLVYHFEEGLEYVLEAQMPVWGERQDAAGEAGFVIEEVRPPVGEAEGREIAGVLGLMGEETVLEQRVHDPGGPAEAVLHGIQDVVLLTVILQQGVDAVAVHPEVEGRALVQELLELGGQKTP